MTLLQRLGIILGLIDPPKSTGCCHPHREDSPYRCQCHKLLGNDFYFLPTGECLERKS